MILKGSVFFAIIIAIVGMVIIAALTIVPALEKIQCEENGGSWSKYFNVGCRMTENDCKDAGGMWEECRPSVGLSCASVCHFR